MSGRSILFAFCLAAISMTTSDSDRARAETRAAAGPGQTIEGVWRSRGYGWLWEIRGGKVRRFDIAETFCIPRRSRRQDTLGPENRAELADGGRTLRIRMGDPDYVYTFDRLPEVPARCREEPSSSPEAVLDAFAAMFETHYPFFEQRGVNWEEAVERARARLRDGMGKAELFELLAGLVSRFEDGHVGLEAKVRGKDRDVFGSVPRRQAVVQPEIAGSWTPRAAVAALGDTRDECDGTLIYGRIDGDIGYLQVTSMSGMRGKDLERALDAAMTSLAGSRAVIVDVSMNGGGTDHFARRIARRFAAEPVVAYSKHPGDFAGATPQEIVLRPTERPSYLGPIFLVTSRETASAAEIFAMAMRALPNVVHVGEATEGSLSDILSKRLPNGWRLSLSNEIYLDSEGVLWEGRGIPPHVPMAMAGDDGRLREGRRAVRDLVDYIRARL